MREPTPPLLLPRPRSIRMIGKPAGREVIPLRMGPSVDLPFPGPEAYRLSYTGTGRLIEARTEQGVRRAIATRDQLARQYHKFTMPQMVIEDGPCFATRGLMLDVSRDRVPTMRQLFQTVDLMAALKFNHLQLYTEHTFAYAGHEEAWRGWSPLTPAEIRELDVYCAVRGIELAANQNCFGHLSNWLNLPRYAHLAETLGEWVFENAHEQFHRSGPFSLCPVDPDAAQFVDELLGQLLPCFSSPLVNIGCDETFDVGFGRSGAAVRERGRAAVYFEFVGKICESARRLGKRPMFWADIALSHPDSVAMIPEDMVCLAWDYEPTARFAEWCSVLRGAGREVWVCPGTSSWRSITGRTRERRGNLQAAAREGSAGGATGFLVTDWGDSGHHQQWPVSLAGIAEAAEAAWCGPDAAYDPRAASVHVFQDQSLATGPWLDELGDLDEPLRRIGGRVGDGEAPTALRNSTVLFNDLFTPIGPGGDEKLRRGTLSVPPAAWRAALERLDALAARKPRGVSALVAQELEHTLEVAHLAINRAIWRRTRNGQPDRIATRLADVITDHRRLWLQRCREGGLDDSCGYYARVLEELRTC